MLSLIVTHVLRHYTLLSSRPTQDAQKAIPKGTLWAILISTITYILMAWMAGSCVLRDAPGLVLAVATEAGAVPATLNLTVNATSDVGYTIAPPEANGTANASLQLVLGKCEPPNCKYGLMNDMQVTISTSYLSQHIGMYIYRERDI